VCTTGAVVEQVAGFSLTEYPPDGKGEDELDFETKLLKYDRRGGFVLALVSEEEQNCSSSTRLREDMLHIWLRRMESLGGQTLLERHGASSSFGQNHVEECSDPDGEGVMNNKLSSTLVKPSFASDRRIVRLVIARIFADILQAKFREQLLQQK
jgi:hypothetical protein